MTFTLVADGSSDRVLLPIIAWCLRVHGVSEIIPQWADFARMPPQRDLSGRLRAAIDLYPCSVLFVHRDAERETPAHRREEITGAAHSLESAFVPVIPVRMTEAWLLFDESSIRLAAGNPNGTGSLGLPPVDRWEALPDPKQVLHAALGLASGLTGRRRHKLTFGERVHRLASGIDDFSALRALSAFRVLENDIAVLVASRPDIMNR